MHAAFLLVLILMAAPLQAAAAEPPRVALVVGNGAYRDGVLRNPPNDARLMAATLRDIGFEVTELVDAGLTDMKLAIVDFGERLEKAGDEAVGLFYYAGHGLQVRGANYLLPVDARIRREADVDIVAVAANWVLSQMEFAANPVNIVILDACRNNPYARGFRSGGSGLARMEAPRGTLIAYATRPGDVAADGGGDNSPYTQALSVAMKEPGRTLSDVFIQTRVAVMAATDERQVPWEEGGLTANYYFLPPQDRAPAPAESQAATAEPSRGATGQTRGAGRADLEIAFWNSVKDSADGAQIQAYLDQFPDGTFAALARARVASLTPAPTATVAGRWQSEEMSNPFDRKDTFVLTITLEPFGDMMTGGLTQASTATRRYKIERGMANGRFDGKMVSFDVPHEEMHYDSAKNDWIRKPYTLRYRGVLEGDTMRFIIEDSRGNKPQRFTARRMAP